MLTFLSPGGLGVWELHPYQPILKSLGQQVSPEGAPFATCPGPVSGQFNLHLSVGPRYRYFFHCHCDYNLQPDWKKKRLQSSDSGSEAILLTPWEHLSGSGNILISHTWGWFMITAQDAAKSPKTHKTTPSQQRFPWSQMWPVLLLRDSLL